jgi:hypothetical protein
MDGREPRDGSRDRWRRSSGLRKTYVFCTHPQGRAHLVEGPVCPNLEETATVSAASTCKTPGPAADRADGSAGATKRRILLRFYAVRFPNPTRALVRGSSRRIMTMRFRPANIRVINRRVFSWAAIGPAVQKQRSKLTSRIVIPPSRPSKA